MILSLALMLLLGMGLSYLFKKIKLPGFLGMIFTGMLLGPYILNQISTDILNISSDLREIALIVILTRAGLSLDLKDLKAVGRPAILMSFLPATIELTTITLLAPVFFNISYIEAAILGAILAAVSPAVVVPKMLNLLEKGYGKKKRIPQLIIAGASVDDIFVIVLFTIFLGIFEHQHIDIKALIALPISIVLGILLGIISGKFMAFTFKRIPMRDTIKVLILLAFHMLLISFTDGIRDWVPIAGMLSIMISGITLLKQSPKKARQLSERFSKIWVFSELMLFILVGAAVNITALASISSLAFLLIGIATSMRICAVLLCLIKTPLNKKERLFTSLSYIPKATVQAAIGSIPLAKGLPSGELILILAILTILVTAPLGGIWIDFSHKKLLKKE